MGKYMRKCKGIGELAVMEVSQVVGVRTRARTVALAAAEAAAAVAGGRSKRRKAVAGGGELEISSYLQLRSRSLVMTPRISRSQAISGGNQCPSHDLDRISRCSSNASSEVASKVEDLRSRDLESEDLESELFCLECSRERREPTPSSNQRAKSDDLESTAERKSSRSTAKKMPSDAEIEEFFAAAERDEKQRFSDKYNYDIVNDAPLEGRFEWVRLKA